MIPKQTGMHINSIVSLGNSILSFIRRNVLTTFETVKGTACKQPVLEYASAAWDSASDTAGKLLEAIQRRGATLICGFRRPDRNTSTTAVLQKLNLPPLSQRCSDRRLQIFSQHHHTNKSVLTKHMQPSGYSSARQHPEQHFIPQSNSVHHQRH